MKKNVEIKKLGINGEGIGYIDRKIVSEPWYAPHCPAEDRTEAIGCFIFA